MSAFLQSESLVFVVLAVLLAEVLILSRIFKKFPGLLGGLAAGACLVLALRAAILNHGTTEILIYLTLSLLCHLVEVWQWLRIAKQVPR
jgi:MFS superfamily sulfate permease-like transporter